MKDDASLNHKSATVLFLALSTLAIAWSCAMLAILLGLKTKEVMEENGLAGVIDIESGAFREAMHRRVDDPSFWVYIAAGLAAALVVGFVVIGKLRLGIPGRRVFLLYAIFVGAGIVIYLVATALKGEAFFWRPKACQEAFVKTNIPKLQRVEGLFNVLAIIVLYSPAIVVSQLGQWNKDVKYPIALRAQMNTAVIPLSLFALVFFSLTFLPYLLGFAIIDRPINYLTGLGIAVMLLLPYICIAMCASLSPNAVKATLRVFKIIPIVIYIGLLVLSSIGLVRKPSPVWVTDVSKASPPWNHILGIMDFFGPLGLFLFAWIW